MIQYLLTPAAGKRLIAKAIVQYLLEDVVIASGTIAVIAGTTNGYVADELLTLLRQTQGFDRSHFFRGITIPPGMKTTESGRLSDESGFLGDVIIEKGKWQKGKTIFDIVDDLKQGDIIVKGANCINLDQMKAGILIGDPKGGSSVSALQAIVGRRVRLLLPVGLEKRISENIDSIAMLLNSTLCTGARMLSVTGEIVTELEAINQITGAKARLIAAGGVCGAEGAIWLLIDGDQEAIQKTKGLLDSLACEPSFAL